MTTVWLQKMGEQSRMLAQEEGCASGWYTGLRRHRSSVWATCEGVQDSLKGPEEVPDGTWGLDWGRWLKDSAPLWIFTEKTQFQLPL